MQVNFITQLEKRLCRQLPGEMARKAMAPLRVPGNQPSPDAGKAAVLILIFPRKGELSTVLIKRTEYPGPHSGQISFPGGKAEKSDSSQINTALREASEETGLDTRDITIIGTLTPLYIPISNLEVLPVVAYTPGEPDFIINRKEVEYLINVPVRELAGNNLKTEKKLCINGITISAPGYAVKDEFIWGATAMIVAEFAEIISEIGEVIP